MMPRRLGMKAARRLGKSRVWSSSMSRRVGRTAVGAICLTAALVLPAQMSSASANPEWHSDGRRWSGTGTVLVPGAGHVGSQVSVQTGCSACRWLVVPACGGPIGPIDPLGPFCGAYFQVICGPSATRFYTLFAASPQDKLSVVAASCIGPDQRPVSQEELDHLVVQHIRALAPSMSLAYQPNGHPVTQLPTIFATGQPRTFEHTDTIAGFELSLVATAHWRWNWGDGSTSETREPGGSWPNVSLAHTYRQAGSMRAAVTATWDAHYSVAGGGSLRVPGRPVSQTAQISLPVRQARAVLTG